MQCIIGCVNHAEGNSGKTTNVSIRIWVDDKGKIGKKHAKHNKFTMTSQEASLSYYVCARVLETINCKCYNTNGFHVLFLNAVLRVNRIRHRRFHVVDTTLTMTNSWEVNQVCPLLKWGSCQGAKHWVLWFCQGLSTNAGRHLFSVRLNKIYAKRPGYMGIQAAYGKGY